MTRVLAPYLIGAVVFAALVGWLFYQGVTHERGKTDLNNAIDYIEGTKDAQDSQTDLPDDDTGNIEWLLRPWGTSD